MLGCLVFTASKSLDILQIKFLYENDTFWLPAVAVLKHCSMMGVQKELIDE